MPRPQLTPDELSEDIWNLYSMKVSDVREQLSYDDAMFRFTGNGSERYIAKYYSTSLMSKDVLAKILEVLAHLARFKVPQPVPCSNGALMTEIPGCITRSGCKTESFLVLFKYIAGDLLCFQKKPPKFWRKLGELLAEINVSMSEVEVGGNFERDLDWDPLIVHRTLAEKKMHFPSHLLPGIDIEATINTSLQFEEILKDYPKQFIHGDVNEYNVIVGTDDDIGIIDFNDLIYGYRVFDVAHCIGYMMEAQKCDVQVARQIFEGCSSVMKLSDRELNLVYFIILSRFILSVSCGQEKINEGSSNQYVTECVENNVQFIRDFLALGKDRFDNLVLGL